MNSVIYAIENISDYRIYVGSSKEFERRKYCHLNALKNGKHNNPFMQNAWNKYGENSFHFTVLEEVEESKLKEREQWWINFLCPFGKNGYNIRKDVTDGRRNTSTPEEVRQKISASERGRKLTPESIAKRSEKRRGRKFPTPWMIGAKKSEETRAKMSQNRKGKYVGEANNMAKLTKENVLDIRERLANGQSGRSISKLYGVTARSIYMIRDGVNWQHI